MIYNHDMDYNSISSILSSFGHPTFSLFRSSGTIPFQLMLSFMSTNITTIANYWFIHCKYYISNYCIDLLNLIGLILLTLIFLWTTGLLRSIFSTHVLWWWEAQSFWLLMPLSWYIIKTEIKPMIHKNNVEN